MMMKIITIIIIIIIIILISENHLIATRIIHPLDCHINNKLSN